MTSRDSLGSGDVPKRRRAEDPSRSLSLDEREFRICGVKLHAVQTNELAGVVDDWMQGERKFHYISSTNINNVAIALESPEYHSTIEQSDLSLPDGVPFLWYGRLKGYKLNKRCGIEEFMEMLFESSHNGQSYSHFFYGNTPGVLDNLKDKLNDRYPNLAIVGMYSPPFRALSHDEDLADVAMINESKADFLWVSLGCPKQEQWLYDHRDTLSVVVGGGAGAVFNFLSGDKRRAPGWIRYLGLEWGLRLLTEPRRLYSRYCIRYPKFLITWAWRSMRGRYSIS